MTTLYVGKFDLSVIGEEQLRRAFQRFGSLGWVRVKDGFAFVNFAEERAAQNAFRAHGQGLVICGQRMVVRWARLQQRGPAEKLPPAHGSGRFSDDRRLGQQQRAPGEKFPSARVSDDRRFGGHAAAAGRAPYQRSGRYCTVCRRAGHDTEVCFYNPAAMRGHPQGEAGSRAHWRSMGGADGRNLRGGEERAGPRTGTDECAGAELRLDERQRGPMQPKAPACRGTPQNAPPAEGRSTSGEERAPEGNGKDRVDGVRSAEWRDGSGKGKGQSGISRGRSRSPSVTRCSDSRCSCQRDTSRSVPLSPPPSLSSSHDASPYSSGRPDPHPQALPLQKDSEGARPMTRSTSPQREKAGALADPELVERAKGSRADSGMKGEGRKEKLSGSGLSVGVEAGLEKGGLAAQERGAEERKRKWDEDARASGSGRDEVQPEKANEPLAKRAQLSTPPESPLDHPLPTRTPKRLELGTLGEEDVVIPRITEWQFEMMDDAGDDGEITSSTPKRAVPSTDLPARLRPIRWRNIGKDVKRGRGWKKGMELLARAWAGGGRQGKDRGAAAEVRDRMGFGAAPVKDNRNGVGFERAQVKDNRNGTGFGAARVKDRGDAEPRERMGFRRAQERDENFGDRTGFEHAQVKDEEPQLRMGFQRGQERDGEFRQRMGFQRAEEKDGELPQRMGFERAQEQGGERGDVGGPSKVQGLKESVAPNVAPRKKAREGGPDDPEWERQGRFSPPPITDTSSRGAQMWGVPFGVSDPRRGDAAVQAAAQQTGTEGQATALPRTDSSDGEESRKKARAFRTVGEKGDLERLPEKRLAGVQSEPGSETAHDQPGEKREATDLALKADDTPDAVGAVERLPEALRGGHSAESEAPQRTSGAPAEASGKSSDAVGSREAGSQSAEPSSQNPSGQDTSGEEGPCPSRSKFRCPPDTLPAGETPDPKPHLLLENLPPPANSTTPKSAEASDPKSWSEPRTPLPGSELGSPAPHTDEPAPAPREIQPPVAPPSTAAPPKKKRGRPRKIRDPNDVRVKPARKPPARQKAKAEGDPADPPAPKKKRGRPPKNRNPPLDPPEVPAIAEVAAVPEMPGMPAFPQMPAVPEIPATREVAAVLEMPAVPELAAVPEMPAIPVQKPPRRRTKVSKPQPAPAPANDGATPGAGADPEDAAISMDVDDLPLSDRVADAIKARWNASAKGKGLRRAAAEESSERAELHWPSEGEEHPREEAPGDACYALPSEQNVCLLVFPSDRSEAMQGDSETDPFAELVLEFPPELTPEMVLDPSAFSSESQHKALHFAPYSPRLAELAPVAAPQAASQPFSGAPPQPPGLGTGPGKDGPPKAGPQPGSGGLVLEEATSERAILPSRPERLSRPALGMTA